jgi:hypothetical protein
MSSGVCNVFCNVLLSVTYLALGVIAAIAGIWIFAVFERAILQGLGFMLLAPAGMFMAVGLCRLWERGCQSKKLALPAIGRLASSDLPAEGDSVRDPDGTVERDACAGEEGGKEVALIAAGVGKEPSGVDRPAAPSGNDEGKFLRGWSLPFSRPEPHIMMHLSSRVPSPSRRVAILFTM